MSPRTRKLRADVVGNRTRSVLAIVSLTVGMMAVGSMHLAGSSIASSFEAGFLASNPPSAMLGTSPFAADLVDTIEAHPAIGEAEGRRVATVGVVVDGERAVSIELVAIDPDAGNRIARVVRTDGVWPPGPGTVVVERASLPELGAKIGDTVTIEVGGSERTEVVVTGTALDVYEVGPMFGGRPRAYVTPDVMADLTGSSELNTLYVRAADDPLDRETAIAAVAALRDDVLTPAGIAVELSAIQDPSVHRADNATSFMVTVLRLMSVLALVIAVALVVNTVASLLTQQRRQLGVMKAVGATSRQLTVQYLAYVLALAIVAVALAIPLSIVVGRFVAGFTAGLANFDLEPMGVPWAMMLLVTTIGIVLPLLAVSFAVRRASRLTVAETVNDRGITVAGRRRRFPLRVARPTLLAGRNATRSRTRLALTVFTIAACGGVLVGVLNTGVSLGRLSDQVAGYSSYDVELVLTRSTSVAEAAAVLQEDRAVTGVEGWLRKQAFRIRPDGTENENVSLTAAPVGSASLRPTMLEGRWYDDGDEHAIVINSHLADEEPDLALGTTVLLDIEGQRRDWTIVGVASTTLVGPVAFLSFDELADELGRPGEANLLTVALDPSADHGATADRLEDLTLSAGLPVGQVNTSGEIRAAVDGLLTLVVAVLLVVGAVLAVIAVVGLAGTMTLGVMEQTREVGVLRTIGASNRAVRRVFLVQGLTIAAIGAVLGVVASVPVTIALRAAISNGLIASQLPRGFSVLGIGIWIVVALAIGAVGASRPAHTAARLTVRDTLAYE